MVLEISYSPRIGFKRGILRAQLCFFILWNAQSQWTSLFYQCHFALEIWSHSINHIDSLEEWEGSTIEGMREIWASKYKDMEDITTLPIFYIWRACLHKNICIFKISCISSLGSFFQTKTSTMIYSENSKDLKNIRQIPLLNLDFTNANQFWNASTQKGFSGGGCCFRSPNHLIN